MLLRTPMHSHAHPRPCTHADAHVITHAPVHAGPLHAGTNVHILTRPRASTTAARMLAQMLIYISSTTADCCMQARTDVHTCSYTHPRASTTAAHAGTTNTLSQAHLRPLHAGWPKCTFTVLLKISKLQDPRGSLFAGLSTQRKPDVNSTETNRSHRRESPGAKLASCFHTSLRWPTTSANCKRTGSRN